MQKNGNKDEEKMRRFIGMVIEVGVSREFNCAV